jgi:hypothetical protein
MALAIVQHHGAIHSNTGITTDGSVTLGSAPTNGNLLIAVLGCNITKANITINTAYWTLFDYVTSADNGQTVVMSALYHYVGASESAALPKFWTAATGGTYWSDEVWEISGVAGSWDTDFLCSVPLWNAPSNSALPQLPIIAAGMALTAVASYNGSSNPSITGSWSLDDSNNNNSNFGSAAGAHRVVANGDTIDGTWTQGTSSPFGGILIILTTLQPSGGLYPRHIYRQSGTNDPASITVPWTPKVGSLLVAYIDRNGTSTNPVIGSSWTEWASVNLTTKYIVAIYRYVQGGDTAALPAMCTSGGSFTVVSVIELGGGSGTFASDHVSDKSATQASGSTLTTTADSTTANNQFALLNYGNFDGNAFATTTGFTNYLADDNAFALYGAWFVAFKFYPSSGSTVQGTTTPGTTTQPQGYIQSIFNWGQGAVNDSVNLVAATSAGAVAGLTPSGSDTPSAAASAGAVAGVKPQISIALAAATSAGAATGVTVTGQGAAATGIGASAAAAAVTPKISIALLAAMASGAARGVVFSESVSIGGVAATAAAEPFSISNAVHLKGVSAYGAAAPFRFGQQIPFPLYTLMRDTPVACVGCMNDTPIALIGRIPPSGPQPVSTRVLLQGVEAVAFAGFSRPFFDVKVHLVGASASGAAVAVVAV